MSLQSQISNLVVRIGTECKSIRNVTGDKSSLATTDKTSLVAAINELYAALGGATQIQDSAGAGDTTHTWSANQIVAQLAQVRADILDGAPAAYDTLLEISTALQANEGGLDDVLSALGNRVRFDAAQSLSAQQKAQAIANIGAISAADVGDVGINFVGAFEAALV